METKKNILVKLLLLIAIVVFQLKCGSNSGTTPAATSYYLSNGICYSTAGTAVSTSYCSSTSTGYTYSNGICYQTSTGTAVATTYCTSTTTATTTTASCTGQYLYYCPNGIAYGITNCQSGYCSATGNCRGYTLYTTSGTAIYCQ